MSHTPTIEDYGIPSHPVVVVSGPRFYADLPPREKLRRFETIARALSHERMQGEFTLVHGKAKGLDLMAANTCEKWGMETIAVPYFGWLRGGGGPARNRFMLEAYKPRRLHSFHDKAYGELPQPGSGTADCIACAIKLGIEVQHHVYGRIVEHFVPPKQEILW